MRYLFCPKCGQKLGMKPIGDEGDVPFCAACGRPWFDTFSTCIITLVVNERQEALLLTQNAIARNSLTLISGYIKPGERAEETARREVLEETGIHVDSLELAGTFWFGPSDMLMVGVFATAKKAEPVLSVEIDGAQWIPIRDALPLVPQRRDSTARKLVELYLERLNNPDS